MSSLSGAVILPELHRTLLFKNRDLNAAADHKDQLFYDIDCFGVKGKNTVTGEMGGLTVGVNRYGLAVANSHVKDTADPSCHVLTEQILMFAKDAEDGLSMTADYLKSGRKYQWSNIVLADLDSLLVIEVAGDQHSIEWSERRVLRTNHHFMLDTEDELRKYYAASGSGDGYDISMKRAERGYALMKEIHSVNDVFRLLRDHTPEPGQSSLCKHATRPEEFATVTSYVVEINHQLDTVKPKILFHVAAGSPCKAQFRAVPLVFPADEEIMKRAMTIYHGSA